MLEDSISILYLADKRFIHVKILHCSFPLSEEQFYRGFFKICGTLETVSYHYTSNSIKVIFWDLITIFCNDHNYERGRYKVLSFIAIFYTLLHSVAPLIYKLYVQDWKKKQTQL